MSYSGNFGEVDSLITPIDGPYKELHQLDKTISAENHSSRDLICFSHLRWHFVCQRPQHLMARFARDFRIFFIEEPLEATSSTPSLDVHWVEPGIRILVPRLPSLGSRRDIEKAQRVLLDRYFAKEDVKSPVLWYYTPMSLGFSDHLSASAVVYDCMDELSAFRGAPPDIVDRERTLMRRADVVFTGGYSLFEAKRGLHSNVHAFPSSVEVAHFATARAALAEPDDQVLLPRPRLGFYGVIDERFDIDLIGTVARVRPDWQLVMIGPVAKIDPATLPHLPNIHYLGSKGYQELPAYLAGWDVALLPFALNEATRFISPTKTPEYLAAGRPVVSTPITDVVRTYGDTGLVRIARGSDDFITAIEQALRDKDADWLAHVDRLLADMSWDATWGHMKELIECVA
ncbi:MAG TPA: glycosyltransferase family 1 protein [Azospirillaceae bacterium]|nr:glycosyltransferase family 1 protein [Azospirillaceae bacterium]